MRSFDVSKKAAVAAQKQQARLLQQKALAKAPTCSHTRTALPAPAVAAPTAAVKLSAKEAKKANKARKKAALNQGMVISAVAPRQAPAATPAQPPLVAPAVEANATASLAAAPLLLGNAATSFVMSPCTRLVLCC